MHKWASSLPTVQLELAAGGKSLLLPKLQRLLLSVTVTRNTRVSISREYVFPPKKHSYSVKSYLEVLDNAMLEHNREDLIFMQDNARIHTANDMKQWFIDNGVYTTD
jgi:hypothetical protein